LVATTETTSRNRGALVLVVAIAEETVDAAMAKREHHGVGMDSEALARRGTQASGDPVADPFAGPNKRRTLPTHGLPTQGRGMDDGVIVGQGTPASMLDRRGQGRTTFPADGR
jgi:pyrimidine oxygenase